MANSVLEQGEKYIRKRKKQKRWLIACGCLAVVAVSGTIAALMMNGHALNHTKRVLNCRLKVHEHQTECRDEAGNLVCGYADYVVHRHNDDCYGQEGELVCSLPVVETHTHTEACYQEEKTLLCTTEETLGHTHTEECYVREEGQEEEVLTCTQEETEGHQHEDACYQTQKVLACGMLELHTHDETCYEEQGEGENKEQTLICTVPVLEEHVHGEECIEVVELSGEEVEDLNQTPEEEQPLDEAEEGEETEAEVQPEDVTRPEDSETADSTGEEARNLITKVFENDTIKVTASYDENAGIPEEAELVVEPVAEEEQDPEQMAAAEELLPEEDSAAKLLYTIGFFLDGQEIEPQGPVTITIQLPEGQEIAEGAPVTVIHFGENGPEVLEGADVTTDEDGSAQTSFDSRAFSKFWIVIGEPAKEDPKEDAEDTLGEENPAPDDGTTQENGKPTEIRKVSYSLSDSFQFETEEFLLNLRVVGVATANVPVESEEQTFDKDPGPETESPEDMSEEDEETGDSLEPSGDGAGEENKKLNAEDVTLELSFLESKEDKYREVMDFVQKDGVSSNLLDLSVMQFRLMYEDAALDVSECTVTAEVALKDCAVETSSEESGDSRAQDTKEDAQESGDSQARDTEEDAQNTEEENVIVSLIQGTDSGYKMADSRSLTAGNAELAVMKAEEVAGDILAMSYTTGEEPSFQVQYYAYLENVMLSPTATGNALEVIDTSGGQLPKNGVTPLIKYILLDGSDVGPFTPKTENVPKKIFQSRTRNFYISQYLENINILYESDSYTLKEIWVLKPDVTDQESVNPQDWLIYTDPAKVKFFYNDSTVSDPSENVIKIENGKTVLRLVYDARKSSYINTALFYDYDITNGKIYRDLDFNGETDTSKQDDTTWYANTKQQGINHSDNYQGNGVKFAFGNSNSNTGTGLGDVTWNGNELNKGNVIGNGYKKCTFGIVTGLNASGKLQYASGIIAPNLFNDGDANGKTTLRNWNLEFNRVGDTYTLASVEGSGSAANLEQFIHPQAGDKTPYMHIYTNNFWPMDGSSTFGADGHDLRFGDIGKKENRKFSGGGLPVGDDGQDHNAYFGMQYAFTFKYTEDYCGPLEYLFFGDDDMWVFLDGKLICDIGGVHSSVGEYVNLWDHLDASGANQDHTLQVFYTERGASGSTCYMQFTLPSVSATTPDTDTGIIHVEKRVDGPDDGTKEFEFSLKINTGNMYPYSIIGADGKVKENGNVNGDGEHTFKLKNGEYLEVKYVPVNTTYTVTEKTEEGYSTTVSVNGADAVSTNEISGTLESGNNKVIYTNHTSYELPKTGSYGKLSFTFSGIALVAAGLMYGYRWMRKRERRYRE